MEQGPSGTGAMGVGAGEGRALAPRLQPHA
jgi:hypothetical protein